MTATLKRVLLVFFILLYPLLGMLWHHGYPVFSIEVLLIAALFLTVGLALGLLLRTVRPLVVNLVLAGLITSVLTVHLNLWFVGIVSTAAVSLLLALSLKRHFEPMLLVVVPALIIGAALDNYLDRSRHGAMPTGIDSHQHQAPVIQVLLDGFVGADGLPHTGMPGVLRDQMLSFFEAYGFEIHTRAYTHYPGTLDSMTRAMNFRNDSENLFGRVSQLREEMSIRENKWFATLREMGYPVVVYQSEMMNFCDTESVDLCRVYPVPNLVSIHENLPSASERARVLLRILIRQSNLLNDQLLRFSGKWGVTHYSDKPLEKLVQDLEYMPGSLFFLHLLLPHQPLVFGSDCSIDYLSDSWERFSASDGLIGNTEESLRSRYPRYLAQAECALSKLESVIDTLKELGLFKESTIIVHGDHGGQLYRFGPYTVNSGRLNHRDLRESYSTLFAVKYPNGRAARHDETISLNVLMAQTLVRMTGRSAEQLGLEVSAEEEPFIYLPDTIPLTRVEVDIFSE